MGVSHYLPLPAGPVSQGDIWEDLPGPPGVDSTCAGIVVTPRCDLVHSKAKVVNFLVVVDMVDYLETTLYRDLVNREVASVKSQIRDCSKQLRIHDLIDLGVTPEEAVASAPAPNPRDLGRFNELVEKLRKLEVVAAHERIGHASLTCHTNSRSVRDATRRVVTNAEADVHFLPPLETLRGPAGLVALLRQVISIDVEILLRANTCRNASQWESARPKGVIASTLPVRHARLVSPYLEPLMARFAALFGRVGVPDLSANDIEQYLSSIEGVTQ